MFTTKSFFASILAAAAMTAVTALPTATTPDYYSGAGTQAAADPATTRLVVVGEGGALTFEPANINAAVGDVVEFHFAPRNHSVVQSSFDAPCVQLADGGFNSGFNFTVAEGESDQVLRITVRDTKPIWFFCGQGNHCNQGMVGVVNADASGANTADAYRAKATQPGVVTQLLEVTKGALEVAQEDNTRLADNLIAA